jgi:hypothetical protein
MNEKKLVNPPANVSVNVPPPPPLDLVVERDGMGQMRRLKERGA